MSDFIYKLRILWWLSLDMFDNWRREIWRKDLDSRICCSGYECGCYGMTIREAYTPAAADAVKPNEGEKQA
jgi:hypothetical protein